MPSVDCSGGKYLIIDLGTVSFSLLAVQGDADLLEGRESGEGWGQPGSMG